MVKKKEIMSKDNIVKTSFILFLKKGYKEVTIKNIMEATNLSKLHLPILIFLTNHLMKF